MSMKKILFFITFFVSSICPFFKLNASMGEEMPHGEEINSRVTCHYLAENDLLEEDELCYDEWAHDNVVEELKERGILNEDIIIQSSICRDPYVGKK